VLIEVPLGANWRWCAGSERGARGIIESLSLHFWVISPPHDEVPHLNQSDSCLKFHRLQIAVYAAVVLQASPIPFRSGDHLQYRHVEEGSGDLGPLFMNLYRNLNRANEIAEHIANYSWFCHISACYSIYSSWLTRWEHSGGGLTAIVEARRKLEYDLRRWQRKVAVNFVKSHSTDYQNREAASQALVCAIPVTYIAFVVHESIAQLSDKQRTLALTMCRQHDSLGGCGVCSKLHALCVTYPIIAFQLFI